MSRRNNKETHKWPKISMRRNPVKIYIVQFCDVSMFKKKIIDRIWFNVMEKKEREEA
jgi:hypothetical protein